jgi:hypothetical protein
MVSNLATLSPTNSVGDITPRPADASAVGATKSPRPPDLENRGRRLQLTIGKEITVRCPLSLGGRGWGEGVKDAAVISLPILTRSALTLGSWSNPP